MCGIVGLLFRDPDRRVARETLDAMGGAIRHRGPDDEGTFIDGPVGIGMRRLSIIDVAGGAQPIFNEDGSKAIVFNGEIYNYRSLQAGLEARGHRFRSRGDTETVLHLFEERGPDCVQELRGMFAFAIWDRSEHRLLLARDRFGIKPLYVVVADWGIAFASELKALHAVGLTGGRLDWQALDMFLQLGYIPAPHTAFADVRKLEPGHLITWQPTGGAADWCYWDLPTATSDPAGDPTASVGEWIDQSVRAHLVSDVPVAAFLSGGLDSSAVVASMARNGETPHAFTARYLGSGSAMADETPLARALADRYGARLTIVDVEPRLEDIFEPIVRALDEPHADESAVPSWLISERVAQEYKVALVGTGGDELFAGYRRHLALLLSEYYARLAPGVRRAAARTARALPEPRSGHLGISRLKRFLAVGAGSAPGRYLDLLNRCPAPDRERILHPDIQRGIHPTYTADYFERLHRDGGSRRGVRAALYLDYKTYLPEEILHLSDRISMAHSLEIRVPFVDHELIEQVFPYPDRVRIGWGRSKHLLRRVLRPRLPDAHFSAPKRGFVGPTGLWLRTELRQMLLDELSTDRVRRLGYFNPSAVESLIDDHFSRRQNREAVLWALLCFSTWHRLVIEPSRLASTSALGAASG